jgi:hypothetical protein
VDSVQPIYIYFLNVDVGLMPRYTRQDAFIISGYVKLFGIHQTHLSFLVASTST